MPVDLPIQEIADAVAERLKGPPQRFLSIEQAATYSSIGEKSVRRLLSSGKLTALRPVRGRIVIDVRELDSHVLSSKKTPRKRRGTRT